MRFYHKGVVKQMSPPDAKLQVRKYTPHLYETKMPQRAI